ncbi:MAG: class I SAM-dependent methyltransferase [Chloroflexi bacterium]|nr:MAG: class I SAM-dependent methyltransferase [Chloroflexota bacterium]
MDHTDHVNLLKPANLPLGGIWADFGAGSGAFTLALRELVGPEATIYVVDKDRGALRRLESAYRQRFSSALRHVAPRPIGQSHSQDGADHLIPLNQDFSRPLELPPLDGIVMANSLHYFKDQERVLRHVRGFLKPNGVLLLVEYNVDSGNLWVPHPFSFETYRLLARRAGFSEPRLLATIPSSFLREFYSAICFK